MPASTFWGVLLALNSETIPVAASNALAAKLAVDEKHIVMSRSI